MIGKIPLYEGLRIELGSLNNSRLWRTAYLEHKRMKWEIRITILQLVWLLDLLLTSKFMYLTIIVPLSCNDEELLHVCLLMKWQLYKKQFLASSGLHNLYIRKIDFGQGLYSETCLKPLKMMDLISCKCCTYILPSLKLVSTWYISREKNIEI